MAELPHGIAVEYWLQRLAGLPARQIPVDAMSTVEVLAEDDDLVRRKLALEILNKDPFEVIEPAVLDQCD